MKNIKKFFVGAFITIQVIALIYLWGLIIYCPFTHTPISNLIDWQWWIFFFTLDLWTAKFLAEKKGITHKN